MAERQVVWLPGFFTDRLHATVLRQVDLVFHDIPILWSLCRAPVVVLDHDGSRRTCEVCTAQLSGSGLLANDH